MSPCWLSRLVTPEDWCSRKLPVCQKLSCNPQRHECSSTHLFFIMGCVCGKSMCLLKSVPEGWHLFKKSKAMKSPYYSARVEIFLLGELHVRILDSLVCLGQISQVCHQGSMDAFPHLTSISLKNASSSAAMAVPSAA